MTDSNHGQEGSHQFFMSILDVTNFPKFHNLMLASDQGSDCPAGLEKLYVVQWQHFSLSQNSFLSINLDWEETAKNAAGTMKNVAHYHHQLLSRHPTDKM